MASDEGERPAKKLRTEAREEAAAVIGLAELAGEALTAEEKSQAYKDTYNRRKAEVEREVAGILADFPELDAKLKAEGVDMAECASVLAASKENVAVLAEVLETLKGLPPTGGRRRETPLGRRRETPLGRRRLGQRGGALQDVVNFFKSICTFPFRVLNRAALAEARERFAPIGAWFANDNNINAAANFVRRAPPVALAWAAGRDLMADDSLITRVITAILYWVGNQINIGGLLGGLVQAGSNVAAMAGAAVWPIAAISTILIVRYAGKEAWKRSYRYANRLVRAEYFRPGMEALPEDVRLMKTFLLAVKFFLYNLGAWVARALQNLQNRREINEQNENLERYNTEAELLMWARRAGVRAPEREVIEAARIEAMPIPAAGLARLRAHGALEPGPGEREAHDGGRRRRRTRKHKVYRRRSLRAGAERPPGGAPPSPPPAPRPAAPMAQPPPVPQLRAVRPPRPVAPIRAPGRGGRSKNRFHRK